jgi:signal transduction histidine kinase
MPFGKAKYRFESEVHLGLLSIVLVLLLLSVASNVVLFTARVRLQDKVADRLRGAVMVVTRTLHDNELVTLPDSLRRQLVQQYELSGLTIVPIRPANVDPASQIGWLRAVLAQLPVSQAPDIIDRLLRAEPNHLMRGDENEFFMVAPLPNGGQNRATVVSVYSPDLAYLEDGNRVVLWIGVGVTLLAGLGYIFLSRFIFRPFRKIREQAKLAGREVAESDHEADAVVDEYRKVIRELRDKEAELTRLNASIQLRADSLEQFNEYLMSSIDSGIISLDLDGKIRAVNDAAYRILELPHEVVHRTAIEILGATSPVARSVETALRGSSLNGYHEIKHTLPTGSELVLGVAIAAVRDRDHQMIGLSVLLNDLTEVTNLRSDLEQKNRLAALGEMAAGLAHQIRNSVGAIAGFGNLLKRKLIRLEQPVDQAEALLKEAREAEDLVSKFLAFARPLHPQPQAVSLLTLLRELRELYRVREDCRHIQCEIWGEDVSVEADPLLLKQVIGNLVDNAIQAYDGRPGRVEVTLAAQKGLASIRIADFGCGIPQDKLDKIFTPFYSSRPSGTGLGLPLASRIVSLHGGRLQVESVEGAGTTILIHLPITASTLEPVC